MDDLKNVIQLPNVKIPIIQGERGVQGPQGETGAGRSLEFEWNDTSLGIRVEGEENYVFQDLKGKEGETVYEIAVKNGYSGTQEQWLESLKGEKGDKGDGVFNRMTYTYTLSAGTTEVELDDDYIPQKQIDVFINGFKLNVNEYYISQENSVYKLKFYNEIDVDDTVLEIVMIETMDGKSLEKEISELKERIENITTDQTVPQHVKDITEADIEGWNGKSDFSGDYEDLVNKPKIPSVEGLATEAFVEEKIGEIDLTGLASEEYVNGKIGDIESLLAEV